MKNKRNEIYELKIILEIKDSGSPVVGATVKATISDNTLYFSYDSSAGVYKANQPVVSENLISGMHEIEISNMHGK